MSAQRDKGSKSCENNQQKAFGRRGKTKTPKWNRHIEMLRPSEYFEIIRVFSRSEEVFSSDRVSIF